MLKHIIFSIITLTVCSQFTYTSSSTRSFNTNFWCSQNYTEISIAICCNTNKLTHGLKRQRVIQADTYQFGILEHLDLNL